MTSLSHSTIQNHGAAKSLYATPTEYSRTSGRRLAGAVGGVDPALARWVEDNRYLYDGILTGTSSLSEPDQAQFMEWWNWAYSQISGSSGQWDPMRVVDGEDVGNPTGGSPANVPPSDPFGGIPGTQGNWIYNEEKAVIGFADGTRRDIWSNDITLQVAQLSADVIAERTVDTGLTPPEEVVKITVRDHATGIEAVYIVHDPDDARITVETPEGSQLTDHTGAVISKKFNPPNRRGPQESSVEPTEENGTLVYEGRVGQTIEFNPRADGEDQKHEVWGDANISVGTRDQVSVSEGIPDKENLGETLPGTTLVVTHPDGSSDTYYLPQPFKVNINALADFVTFGGLEMGEVDEVPAEFQEFVTLNAGEAGSEEANAHPEDTQPDEVEGNSYTYNTAETVEIHASFGAEEKNNFIYTNGTVTLHASSFQDDVNVITHADTGDIIVSITNSEGETEIYYVRGASQVNIEGALNVTGAGRENPRVRIGGRAPGEADPSAPVDERTADLRGTAEQLADLPGVYLSADEIMREAERLGLNLNALPTDITNPSLIEFLVSIDETLRNRFESYVAADEDRRESAAPALRDRLVQVLSVLLPDAGLIAGNDGDDVSVYGANRDLLDQDDVGSVTIGDYSTYANILQLADRDG